MAKSTLYVGDAITFNSFRPSHEKRSHISKTGAQQFQGTRANLTAGHSYPFPGSDEGKDYINITTTGNVTEFGEISESSNFNGGAGGSSGARAITMNGGPADMDIHYWDVYSSANAVDWGADDIIEQDGSYGASDGYRCWSFCGSAPTHAPDASYVTYVPFYSIGTAATDWGESTNQFTSQSTGACSSGVRAVFGGTCVRGATTTAEDAIGSVAMQTNSSGTDFGNLANARIGGCWSGDGSRGICFGGTGTGSTDDISATEYVNIDFQSNAYEMSSGNHGVENNRLYGHAMTSDGSRIVIYGGHRANFNEVNPGIPSTNMIDTVQYISIQSRGTCNDFGELTEVRARAYSNISA